MQRKILTVLVLLLFAAGANAQIYTITNHSIDIFIAKDGSTNVVERFYLEFPNETHLQLFREKSEQIGISFEGWRDFDSSIHIYIGSEDDISSGTISFVENNAYYLELNYQLDEPIAQRVKETSRIIEFKIKEKFFTQFLQGGLWVIPKYTTITFVLPLEAVVNRGLLKPEATVSGRYVGWSGYKSSTELEMRYSLVKEIAPTLNLGELLKALTESDVVWFIAAAILIIALVVFVKRKSIGGRIEGFIINHSDLGPGIEEEEGEESAIE